MQKSSKRTRVLKDAKQSPNIGIAHEKIPTELKAGDRWVLWNWVRKNGKWAKLPHQRDGRSLASVTNAAHRLPYKKALAAAQRHSMGVGFVLGDGFVGVDIDDCRDPDTGKIAPWARTIIKQLGTYAEVSPSGTGVKLFLRGKAPKLSAHQFARPDGGGAVEIYADKRYFTVTGDHLPDTPKKVIQRSNALAAVVKDVQKWRGKKPSKATAAKADGMSFDDDNDARAVALAALQVLDASCSYDDWIKIGMALHAVDPSDAMLAHFEDWSASSEKYAAGEPSEKWQSFRGDGGITVSTLCQMANETGENWRANIPRFASDAFRAEPLSLHQLVKQFPRRRQPVVKGLIRKGETCNLIARSKVGKSWLGYQLGLCVASGRKWLNRFTCNRGRVLLIDNELHQETLSERLKTVAATMEIEIADLEDHFDVLLLRGKGVDVKKLLSQLKSIEPNAYSLIIIDAFYRVLPRGCSENDNAQITAVYNLIDRLCLRTGAAVVLVHHTTKGSQSGKNVTDVGSGAGAISRAADSHVILRPAKGSDTVVLEAAVRSFKPVEPIKLRWRYPVWKYVGKVPERASEKQDRKANNEQKILKFLEEVGANGASKTKTRDETGVRTQLEATLNRLLDRQQIERCEVQIASNKTAAPGYRIVAQ